MGWADKHITDLEYLGSATFRPQGNSMQPLIESNDLVKVIKLPPPAAYKVGDVVLCRLKGKQYLHKVLEVSSSGLTYKIGNNKGFAQGWVRATSIFGLCVEVNGKPR